MLLELISPKISLQDFDSFIEKALKTIAWLRSISHFFYLSLKSFENEKHENVSFFAQKF